MSSDLGPLEKARQFLEVASRFQLGELSTERPNPLTQDLSLLSQTDLSRALAILKQVDLLAIEKMHGKIPALIKLKHDIEKTLQRGDRVFLCGCGATGRLSLALETLWRILKGHTPLNDKVVSFMAGGDVALIASIEKFEDYPHYGARQLEELGFKSGDLLIACTEGGETPWVIGATEHALLLSAKNPPYFLYCNPDEILCAQVERSKKIISNAHIKKINLDVGPMSLSGSTRMQATTVLMAAVGWALCAYGKADSAVEQSFDEFLHMLKNIDLSFLKHFIERETGHYQRGEHLYYSTDSALGISILTDTTERSPTFSLHSFENQFDQHKRPSLCYLLFAEAGNSEAAWQSLLHRDPRSLEWQELGGVAGKQRLLGFDFSGQLPAKRAKYLHATHHNFEIKWNQQRLIFELDDLKHELVLENKLFLNIHLLLKVMINDLSTIIMGRLGRYEGNVMTWVRPSNNKLIDRTVRYAKELLSAQGVECSYETLVLDCFELMETLSRDESTVLAMVKRRAGDLQRQQR